MRDLRYAFHALLRVPGFTAAAVMTLAPGSGTTGPPIGSYERAAD